MHFTLFVFRMLMGKNGFYFLNVHFNFEFPVLIFTLLRVNMLIHLNTLHSHKASVQFVSNQNPSLMLNLYIVIRGLLCVNVWVQVIEFVHCVPNHIIAFMLHQCRRWRLGQLTVEVLRWRVQFRETVTAVLY